MKKRIMLYLIFAVLFWVPFYALVHFEKFSETTALIAAVVGVVPILLLSIPIFEFLATRISAVKVAGVELELKREIKELVHGPTTEQVNLTIDQGREVIYGKANMDEFTRMVYQHIANPSKRLVILIDLHSGERVYLPMLYFQARHLLSLFSLRAFLFTDSRQSNIESQVLGTIPPQTALNLIDRYMKEDLDQAYGRAVAEYQSELMRGDLEAFINKTWNAFSHDSFFHEQEKNLWLSNEVFRLVFADHLEVNLLPFPLTESDYGKFLTYLQRPNNHLILIKDETIVNVRSVDSVAREIARSAVLALMRQRSVVVTNKVAAANTEAKKD